MKAISLHQPWASLIAIGAKEMETRHWTTEYRGPIAIHAAKSKANEAVFYSEPFRSVFASAYIRNFDQLPFGAIIAEGVLERIFKADGIAPKLSANEKAFGDFSAGRAAWWIKHIRAFEPVPFVGQQGLFEIPVNLIPEPIVEDE